MSTQYDFSVSSEDSESDTGSVYEIYEVLEHSKFDSIRDKCYDRSEAEDRLAELGGSDSKLDREYYIRAIER